MRFSIFSTRATQLVALVVLASICHFSYADSSYDAEGQRRAQSAGALLLGKPGPAAVLKTIDGQEIDLSTLYGKKPIYLKFWATWCVPCRQQMPAFEKTQQTLGDKIQVIAVNTGFSDDKESVIAYRKEHGLSMPIAIDDGSLAADLNLRVTPQHVLINRSGHISYVGHLDDQQLHDALQKLLLPETETAAPPRDEKSAAEARFAVGDQVAGLKATTMDGANVDLAAAATGKPRALVFFAPWCEWYLEESRPQTSKACVRVRKEVDHLLTQGDVEWLGISSGLWATQDDLQDYLNTSKTKLPLALDANDELFRAFGIREIPSVVLLDANGRVNKILGPQDAQLSSAVQALR
ncbi:TlpA disulfide reductase family protein [Pseudomonas sp. sp1636]|uniref:TlpA family protein disulfide reductase n=1 Tax=Pseudomonas sp. sp1636 TaxID=3036707 RepID=UPI0025A5B9B3|nr:TlpA disulfide reductase family protein [Pseudomonas sp. sp1636]MDM8350974.1 TlpA disulfide reductase family protein [Pseudomonas sp. sp1636]